MSESAEELQRRIAELEAQLRSLQAAVAPTGDAVAGDKVGGDKIIEPQGAVNVSDDARINGVAVGINLGTIIYERPPGEEERRRLVCYLARLMARLYRLSLRGLEERLDQGDGLALPQIYVMLTAIDERFRGIVAKGVGLC